MNLHQFPGYIGVHTRDEAPGALRNGTRVCKIASEPNETHKDGDMATVLGSVSDPTHGIGYFVEWDTHPGHAVLIVAGRCRAVAH